MQTTDSTAPVLTDPPSTVTDSTQSLFKKRGKKKKKSKKLKRSFNEFANDENKNDIDTRNNNPIDNMNKSDNNDNNSDNNSDSSNDEISSIAKKRRKLNKSNTKLKGSTFATTTTNYSKQKTDNNINNDYGYSATFSYESNKSILSNGKADQGATVEMSSRKEEINKSDIESM